MEKVNVYMRNNKPVYMMHRSGPLFEKLDEEGETTGAIVNLEVALDCRAYFTGPRKGKEKKNEKHNSISL